MIILQFSLFYDKWIYKWGQLRDGAEFYCLSILDLYASSGLQPEIEEIKENFIPDGLHPNDAGNAVIAKRLKAFLENL